MEALSRNVYTGRADEYSVDFDNFDEDIPDSDRVIYPSDNPTDSDDDTL